MSSGPKKCQNLNIRILRANQKLCEATFGKLIYETMGSCWEVVARTVTAYMPSFNKIRSGSVVPEIRLLGQMSPGQMLLGQMLIGQMLIGQIVNRKLLP